MNKSMNTLETYHNEIRKYYEECWISRFKKGHNPLSHAIHMGYFDGSQVDNDRAKVEMNRFLASQLPIHKDEHKVVIDVGCGVGSTSIYLSENFPHLKIKGVNIDPKQIAFIKEYNPECKVEFLCEDYAHTSLDSESADVVYAMESSCHANDKKEFFGEIFRILKKGGQFVMQDYFDTRKKGITSGETTEKLIQEFKEGWAVREFVAIHNEQVLRDVGFSHVDSQSMNKNVMPGIQYSYDKAIAGIEKKDTSASNKLHMKANIALKKLMDIGIVDYRIVKSIK